MAVLSLEKSVRNVFMRPVVIGSERIVICLWVVKFVIVYPPAYLEEHLAQSLLYILYEFCRMCTSDLQESRCHLMLAVNCKTLGFHLTNLQSASMYVYAPRSQTICIVNYLGIISVFLTFSAWKESSVWMRLRGYIRVIWSRRGSCDSLGWL